MKFLFFGALFVSSFCHALTKEKVVEGLTLPWGMVFLNGRQLLVTEKLGAVKIVDVISKKITLVKADISSSEYGQGGLLDVTLDPDFKSNQKIYFTYTKNVEGNYTTALGSGQLFEKKAGAFYLENVQELFVAEPALEGGVHFGSRLLVTEDTIWMTMGERNHRDLAQDLSTHLGKVLRLDKNGKAHASNPFLKRPKARPEIWSYGHRNAQGLVQLKNGELWVSEHGPLGGDELNLVKKGANYGWPVVTYGREYSGEKITDIKEKLGIESPIHYYVPSIAPCGMTYYTGDAIPELKDSFLIGALALMHLNQVKIVNQKFVYEKRHFTDEGLRTRDVESGPDGLIYFMTDSGELYRIKN